jgi:hypothetical protein
MRGKIREPDETAFGAGEMSVYKQSVTSSRSFLDQDGITLSVRATAPLTVSKC